MPATEQTWRSLKTMHVVFAVSSLAMLFATIWMLSADNNREWKPIQRTEMAIETSAAESRIIEQQTTDYLAKHDELARALTAARLKTPDESLYGDFKHASEQFAKAWNEKADERIKNNVKRVSRVTPFDFSKADAVYKTLPELNQKARDARQEAEKLDAAAQQAWDAYLAAAGKLREAEKVFSLDAAKLKEQSQAAEKTASEARAAAKKAGTEATDAEQQAIKQREAFFAPLRDAIKSAKQTEDGLTQAVKFRRGDFDEARSNYDIAVGQHAAKDDIERLEAISKSIEKNINDTVAAQQEAKEYRLAQEKTLRAISDEEDKAKKAFDDNTTELTRLEKSLKERASNLGKQFLELPVADAFNSPLKIANRWLPDLTININFRDVPRFDRCETCHMAIEKTAAGSASAPGYPLRSQEPTVVLLQTPPAAPQSKLTPQGEEIGRTTKAAYGLELAKGGWTDTDKVTVDVVWPKTPAAEAGLIAGDVIETIKGTRIISRASAEAYLLEYPEWGKPLELKILRGLPNPYATHPRLDLFLGSLSPHPTQKFGCTICHDGQGGGTAFKWASHSPNDPDEAKRWATKYGWFSNHDWIFPMFPRRFAQSACMKCHFDVVALEPSAKFPEPPAPQLVEGYNLVRRYGCFGCHEINGYDGPNKRIGPDLRLEPNYAGGGLELALELAHWKPALAPVADACEKEVQSLNQKLKEAEANKAKLEQDKAPPAEIQKATDQLAQIKARTEATTKDSEALNRAVATIAPLSGSSRQVAAHADDHELRTDLLNTYNSDIGTPLGKLKTRQVELPPRIAAMTTLLKDVEAPGKLRKPGPSLRYVGSKVDYDFLYSWIYNPSNFRPTTRMPRFFGQHMHLQAGEKEQPWALTDAQRYEPIEVRAAAEYLLNNSQPFDYIEPDPKLAAKADAIRGKHLFQTRGCLACHTHADFKDDRPESQAIQGPDLSRIGAKLTSHAGKEDGKGTYWLYSWVKDPSRYHARTVMPNLFLNPITDKNGDQTDPAADITAYLMNSQQDWKPTNVPSRGKFTAAESKALYDLSVEYLKEKVSEIRAFEYIGKGIPIEEAGDLKGDEVVLIRDVKEGDSPEVMRQKTLKYIGRRTISKYGCAGCHDIPGFEDAKTIGTSLADWGRKDPTKLAFEQITNYIGGHGGGHGAESKVEKPTPEKEANPAVPGGEFYQPPTQPSVNDPVLGYFVEKLLHGQREGFLWQKLREPRSYDYMKFMTPQNKRYNERLRMPKFTFAIDPQENQKDIERVMTFVLGLLAEPAPPQYVYNPDVKQKAIVRGRVALEKYNCGGCHTLEMARWKIGFRGDFAEQPAPQVPDFPFLNPHFTPEEIDTSAKADRRERHHAQLEGLPAMDPKTGKPNRINEDGETIDDGDKTTPGFYTFELFKPALIEGKPYLVGVKNPLIPEAMIEKRYPPVGGGLARLLYPVVVKEGQQSNPNLAAGTTWGWLPPPLINEGTKVQSQWLHDFLLDPYQIRPAVVLRMPKFNMSSDEATSLVEYFSAMDNAEMPYEFAGRARESHLDIAREEYHAALSKAGADKDRTYLSDALKIVTNNDYCVKCHLVADFKPQGDASALAPNLAQVHNRMRPEYLRRWLSDPARILPYTAMPMNIKPNEPAKQDLFVGDSLHQIDGLVDLLLNFERYTQEKVSIKDQVKPAPAAPSNEAKGSE